MADAVTRICGDPPPHRHHPHHLHRCHCLLFVSVDSSPVATFPPLRSSSPPHYVSTIPFRRLLILFVAVFCFPLPGGPGSPKRCRQHLPASISVDPRHCSWTGAKGICRRHRHRHCRRRDPLTMFARSSISPATAKARTMPRRQPPGTAASATTLSPCTTAARSWGATWSTHR